LGGRSAAKGSGAAILEYSFVCFEWVAGFVWTELYFWGCGVSALGEREQFSDVGFSPFGKKAISFFWIFRVEAGEFGGAGEKGGRNSFTCTLSTRGTGFSLVEAVGLLFGVKIWRELT
jgi:hypothetical protein